MKIAYKFEIAPASREVKAFGHLVYPDGAIRETIVGSCRVDDVLALAYRDNAVIAEGTFEGRQAVLWEHLYEATGTVPPPPAVTPPTPTEEEE